jgi:hypothetical protein
MHYFKDLVYSRSSSGICCSIVSGRGAAHPEPVLSDKIGGSLFHQSNA